ncbi:MAG: VOC family protein [Acidimicrobiales bacterium]
MGERTSYAPGTFCWVDLATTDVAGALAFYGGLFGWEGEEMAAGPASTYTMLRHDGRHVAALYEGGEGAPAAWLSYVSVDDVDSTADRAAALGALVVQGPSDVLDAGRMAVLADPTGALVALWQPGRHIGATLVNDPGALCLNQLNTGDPQAATHFYGELFGWTVQSNGTAEQPYWGLSNGGALNGGMMPLAPVPGLSSHWLAYFTTADLDAAVVTAAASGGAVIVPPMVVPAGRIAVIYDPQGAAFALFEGEVDP